MNKKIVQSNQCPDEDCIDGMGTGEEQTGIRRASWLGMHPCLLFGWEENKEWGSGCVGSGGLQRS